MRKAINPSSMFDSIQYGFSHAIKSEGATLLHLSGQVAWDAECNLIGEGDLAAQARQVLKNLKAMLADQGATPADVVRIRTYIVNYSPDMLEILDSALAEFYGDTEPAANTLLGVQSLALPEFMIEIEATAILQS